ncbi:DUF2142 domain-containing protein, partial [Candidatus Saccharibacteria bacterium]|nr:DUF2142 domain-containing protein [Candidatus Saccharibacteria bacterium]
MKKWKAIIGAISGFTYKFGFEKLFLIIILPLGITYMVISPVLSGNDDRNHFMRAYEIANGKLVTANIRGDQVGGEWDKAFNELVVKEPSYSREKENISVVYIGENEFYNYPNTALYSPISYLPQTIGILIGKVFSASPYALVNFARIFNFIFYVIICYVAFKLLPRFKLFFLVLMTSPAILLSATSISADSFLCALIFLLAALIQYMNDKKIEFSWRHGSIFAGLAILISGCKVVYFPAILLLFLIDKNAFKSRKSKILWCVGLVSIGVAVGVVWMKISSGILESAYPMAGEQELKILQEPFRYIGVLARDAWGQLTGLVSNLSLGYVGNIYSGAPLYNSRLSLYKVVVWG